MGHLLDSSNTVSYCALIYLTLLLILAVTATITPHIRKIHRVIVTPTLNISGKSDSRNKVSAKHGNIGHGQRLIGQQGIEIIQDIDEVRMQGRLSSGNGDLLSLRMP